MWFGQAPVCPVCSANTMQNFFFTKLVSVGIEYIKKKKKNSSI